MEFEDILKNVGDFGWYQKFLLVVFLVPTYLFIPWVSLNAIFISATPQHWCYVPEVHSSNLSTDEQKYLIRPPQDPSCSRYDVNYTGVLHSDNITVDESWSVIECDLGWQYDNTHYDETAVTKWNLVCENDYFKSMVVSLVFFGVIIGTPLYGYLSDRCGRKPTFLGLTLIVAIAEIGSAFSPSLMLFLVLRIIIGSTMTCLYSLGYIIVLELVSPNIRSRINGVATNCWSLGLCLLPLLAYITRSWVYLSIVMAGASSACFLLAYFILPESPSWLISQEKYEEAAKILEKISKMNCQDVSYEELLKNIQNLEKKKKKIDFKSNSPISLFTYPNMRKRFFFCIIVMIGVSIPYYGLQENIVNLSGNEFLNFFFLSLIEIPAHLLTWWLLNKIGRKKTIKFAFIFTIVFCLIPVFSPQDNSEIQIVVAICGKAGASAAFMAQYQHCPELVPTPLRGIAMGFISTIGVGSTLFSPFIVGLDKHGSYLPYLVFAIICSACGFCGSFLPETLGKVLPQSVEDVENADKHRRSLCTGWCMMKKYDLQDEDSNKSEDSKCKVPNVTIHLSAHTLNNLKCL